VRGQTGRLGVSPPGGRADLRRRELTIMPRHYVKAGERGGVMARCLRRGEIIQSGLAWQAACHGGRDV